MGESKPFKESSLNEKWYTDNFGAHTLFKISSDTALIAFLDLGLGFSMAEATGVGNSWSTLMTIM